MATTPNDLNGLFKDAYADEIKNLIPETAKLSKLVKFVSKDKENGNKYNQPVILNNEQGVTYAAPDTGAFDLEPSVSMTTRNAEVQGVQSVLRAALSYDAAAKASNSVKAFVSATDLIVENMIESITKRLEISMLYGQAGLAQSASSANSDSTTTVITVTAASWASGIWSGAERSKIQFYRVDTDALVSSGDNSVFTVIAVDNDARKLTVEGTATGITALDAVTNTPGVVAYFKGSKAGDMAGLKKIITNSGTLFNINAATYNLWKGNSFNADGALTMAKIQKAVSKAVQRGLDEDVVVLVNPETWGNLNSDLAALRRFDSSYDKSESESGSEAICYYGQNGKIEVIAHNCVKEGDAFVLPPKKAKRIGAQEVSFETPGKEGEIFLHLPNNAGYELRVYSNQALFLEAPARCVYIYGIVNS